MEYLQLSDAEREEMLANALYAREREHFEYDAQVRHQESLLAKLPEGDWPKEIGHLKGLQRDEMIVAAASPEELTLAADFAERDRIAVMLAAAKVERARVERYHQETLQLLPAERRADAFAAAAAKRTEVSAARRPQ